MPRPQELVPLVQVPKPPTIHYQPAPLKLFDIPASICDIDATRNTYSQHEFINGLTMFCIT